VAARSSFKTLISSRLHDVTSQNTVVFRSHRCDTLRCHQQMYSVVICDGLCYCERLLHWILPSAASSGDATSLHVQVGESSLHSPINRWPQRFWTTPIPKKDTWFRYSLGGVLWSCGHTASVESFEEVCVCVCVRERERGVYLMTMSVARIM